MALELAAIAHSPASRSHILYPEVEPTFVELEPQTLTPSLPSSLDRMDKFDALEYKTQATPRVLAVVELEEDS